MIDARISGLCNFSKPCPPCRTCSWPAWILTDRLHRASQHFSTMAEPSTDPLPDFRQRLQLDESRGEWLDGPRRYLMIRPDGLMGLFAALPVEARLQALQALGDSVCRQGGDSARAYLAHGGGDRHALLQTLQNTAPQLGWGVWRFEHGPQWLRLVVHNSPFAHGHGPAEHPVCHAINGMLQGVAGLWFGQDSVSSERQCEAQGAPSCVFEARPLAGTEVSGPR